MCFCSIILLKVGEFILEDVLKAVTLLKWRLKGIIIIKLKLNVKTSFDQTVSIVTFKNRKILLAALTVAVSFKKVWMHLHLCLSSHLCVRVYFFFLGESVTSTSWNKELCFSLHDYIFVVNSVRFWRSFISLKVFVRYRYELLMNDSNNMQVQVCWCTFFFLLMFCVCVSFHRDALAHTWVPSKGIFVLSPFVLLFSMYPDPAGHVLTFR